MLKIIIVLFFIIIVFGLFFSITKTSDKKSAVKYSLVPILTPNEIEFFGRLMTALGEDHYIFSQVALSALIKPLVSFKQNKTAYWKINQKRVDFVVYRKDMSLVCIVELDDKMHDAVKDKERDSWTASADIKTFRWQSKNKPTPQIIRQSVIGSFGNIVSSVENSIEEVKPII